MVKINQQDLREIKVKGSEPVGTSIYSGNLLKLSRYTWFTIIPKNLFEQFQRTSNIWFLVVSILQLIPSQLDLVDGWITIFPLGALLILTLLKDLYIDKQLEKQDNIINNTEYLCWNGSAFNPKKCKDILVGDIVLLMETQLVPADILLLDNTNPDKIVYANVTRITGSTILSQVKAVQKTHKMINISEDEIIVNNRLNFTLKILEPNLDYSSFYGRLKVSGDATSLELKVNNVLFKGSTVCGVNKAVGVVMYCGVDSKLQLNTKAITHRTSALEKKVNGWVIYILCCLALLILFSVVLFYVLKSDESDTGVINSITIFVLLYKNIVPISLFLVIDIIRIVQSYIITKAITGTRFNTERFIENLGQVEYILADKTGTITESKIVLRGLIIEDNVYFSTQNKNSEDAKSSQAENYDDVKIKDFGELEESIQNKTASEIKTEFIKSLGLCQTLTKYNDEYLGSQDEIAIVSAIYRFGVELDVTKLYYTLKINDFIYRYEIIGMRPYISINKRSRILLLEPGEKNGILYVKGECNTLLYLISATQSEKNKIWRECNDMNNKGYRAMVYAYKKIPLEETLEFKSKIKKAENSLLNSDRKIEKMFRDIERGMNFIGITCTEEEILPSTLRAISNLKKANIKIWMVSGDTYGNTSFAGRSSGVIEEFTNVVHIKNVTDEFKCFKLLSDCIHQVVFYEPRLSAVPSGNIWSNIDFIENDDSLAQSLVSPAPISNRHSIFKRLNELEFDESEFNRSFELDLLDYSLVIDRKSFLIAINHENCRKLLVMLLVCAKSACFSNFMPLDKAYLIKLLKQNVAFKPLVVAVGNGEGDIGMLQNSDLGISVNSDSTSILKSFSNISVSKFSDIEKLILKHGYWNYRRLSKSIFLFAYKNLFVTIMLFAFNFLNLFTGTSIFSSSSIIGYNMLFTTLPVVYIGIYDLNISEDVIYSQPEVYIEGTSNNKFLSKMFLPYIILALIQGTLLSIVGFTCIPQIIAADGKTEDLVFLGTLLYIILILVVLIECHIETHRRNWLYYLLQSISITFVVVFIVVQNHVGLMDTDLIGIGTIVAKSPYALFSIFFTTLICVIPRYAFYFYKNFFVLKFWERILIKKSLIFKYIKLNQYKDSLLSVYAHSTFWKNSSKDEKFAMKKYTLKFKLPYVEKEFLDILIIENLPTIKITVIVIWIMMLLWTILEIALLSGSFTYNLTRIVISVGSGIFLLIIYTDHFKTYYHYYILPAIFIGIIVKLIIETSFNYTSVLTSALTSSVAFILLNVNWFYTNLLSCLNVVFLVIALSVQYNQVTIESTMTILEYLIFIISITSTLSIVGYYIETFNRTEYKLLNISNKSVETNQSILSLLLPPFVKNRVKEGVRYIAEAQGEVTVLFCDICDFETICRDYKPNDLRVFLDSLFRIFDNICENTGVTKIETVGKTYMACAGITDSELELPQSIRHIPHARRILELAICMIQEISNIRLDNESMLRVKIGINTGPVVAGVVGYHKPQFSLVGDTVNTASRMCSTLTEYNSIQISQSTYKYLCEYPEISFRENKIEAKGKGILQTYIVTDIKEEMIGNNEQEMDINKLVLNQIITSTTKQTNRTIEINNYRVNLENRLVNTRTVLLSPYRWVKTRKNSREKEYLDIKIETNHNMMLLSSIIACFTYFCMFIFSLVEYYLLQNYSNIAIIIGRGVIIIYLIVIIAFRNKLFKVFYYQFIVALVLILMLMVSLFNLIYSTQVLPDFIALEIMYIIIILNHSSSASLGLIITGNFCIFIPWAITSFYSNSPLKNLTNILIVFFFSGINFFSVLLQEKKNRGNYNLNILANKEIRQTKNLLAQMMPSHALEGLQNDISVTDTLDNVTILYADIVGFTNWSSDKTPEAVVEMLSDLFTSFDKVCVENNVYKVHTIGDCYVVLGFQKKNERDPVRECLNVIRMAENMVDIIYEKNIVHESSLNMRIGIHTGNVIAGIIGTNSVRYDIWGLDVLIANKMESTGKQGRINISESTKNMLESHDEADFKYQFNAEVNVPGLDKTIKSFFIN
jgi:phospholipid-translocating P-type ATPase (flippase)